MVSKKANNTNVKDSTPVNQLQIDGFIETQYFGCVDANINRSISYLISRYFLRIRDDTSDLFPSKLCKINLVYHHTNRIDNYYI